MDKYLNKGVKDVIIEFPRVGEVLTGYNVGCTSCEMGSCLLKDVIGVHNLSKNQEKTLMAQIEQIIYPQRDIVISVEEELEETGAEINYSKPIQMLVKEHDNIKLLLDRIPALCYALEAGHTDSYLLIEESIEFIKNYADSFHHAKEEDILFKYASSNQEIISTMLEEHKLGRWFVKLIIKGISKKDNLMISENLRNYGELLRAHIKKEDSILYPYIDKHLTQGDRGILDIKFREVNKGNSSDKYVKWVKSL